jgi:hypothetical protein
MKSCCTVRVHLRTVQCVQNEHIVQNILEDDLLPVAEVRSAAWICCSLVSFSAISCMWCTTWDLASAVISIWHTFMINQWKDAKRCIH